MKRKTVLLALSGLLVLTSPAYATEGAYSSTMNAPDITLKNQWYQKNFPVISGTPSTGKIGIVYYNWAFSRTQQGLKVSLCTSANTMCVNIGNSNSGSVDLSTYNLAPNQVLSMKAIVEGTGTMVPVYGYQSQIIVNYKFN